MVKVRGLSDTPRTTLPQDAFAHIEHRQRVGTAAPRRPDHPRYFACAGACCATGCFGGLVEPFSPTVETNIATVKSAMVAARSRFGVSHVRC